ncbi:MAG: ABC transporter substrate-binding protein [Chromatiaceae bacterium]|nr:ABC transporter substrate-binding protein [Candidatus Thioaporhodococcus sediminis]
MPINPGREIRLLRLLFTLLLLCFLPILPPLMAGCSGEQGQGPAGASAPVLQQTALQLNWVPEPEFGGYYAARETGAFAAEGLEVDIRPGGAQSPVEQMVAAGQVEFGITSADSLLMARDRGVDLVAIYAGYQSFPEGIMVHASRGLKSLAEVFKGGTLAVIPGTPFLKLLDREYGLGRMKVVPHDNNIAPFLQDPLMAQQCFVSSEPIVARHAGANPQVFMLSDIGFNPYTGVVFTRRQTLEAHPERVRTLVRAVRRGWQAYLADPEPANRLMHTLNPTMAATTFAEASLIQAPLIRGGLADDQLGTMTLERWRNLAELLQGLGIIQGIDPDQAFVNP